MASFKDSQDRSWKINLDGPKIMAIREECDSEFLKDDFTDQSKPSTFARLQADPVLLCRVIFLLCEKQINERNVDEEDFYSSVIGESLDAATDALLEAVVNFSPRRTREMLEAFVAQDKIQQEATKRILEKVNSPALMNEALAKIEAKVDAGLEQILTSLSSATDTQESSESTPTA